MQTKPKGVTTQMKALDEYILMVLFAFFLKRKEFISLRATMQVKAFDENTVMGSFSSNIMNLYLVNENSSESVPAGSLPR